jgi:hypothetical protein
MEIDLDYEGNALDAAQLKKDNFHHALTAYENLKRFTSVMAATPVDKPKRREIQKWMKDPYKKAPNKAQYWPKPNHTGKQELQEAHLWLAMNANDIPSELEDEQGRAKNGRSYYEIPEAVIRDKEADIAAGGYAMHAENTRTFAVAEQSWDDDDADNVSKYEAHGLYHAGRTGCNASLLDITKDIADKLDPETAALVRSMPTSQTVRSAALKIRGERYRKYAETQAKRLRWRGMEYMDASAKADAHMESGKQRSKVTSNAKPLPDVGVLAEHFVVEDGQLVRIKAGRGVKLGPVTTKQVRVDGVQYRLGRIIYALTTGQDAGDKVVRNGVASSYRKAEGYVTARADGNYDARLLLGKDIVTIGEYDSEDYASKACGVFLRSLEMGL